MVKQFLWTMYSMNIIFTMTLEWRLKGTQHDEKLQKELKFLEIGSQLLWGTLLLLRMFEKNYSWIKCRDL